MDPVTDPAALFQSVSDASRLRLLRLLSREELNVQELVRITGHSQPRVSKHLALLRDQGWITQRREGTWSWYRAVSPADFPAGEALFNQVINAAGAVSGAEGDNGLLQVILAERMARARDVFAGIAHRWDDIRQEYEHPDIRLGSLAALVDSSLRVLDIGTGTGAMLPVFGGAVDLVVALDNSRAMLGRARDLCREQELDTVRFCNADVAGLPFVDGAFDAVNCSMVLHHVARPSEAMAEMARVTRPGGRVMVTAFSPHDQAWMRDELAHQWLGFSEADMVAHMAGAGLRMNTYLVRSRQVAAAHANGQNGKNGKLKWPDVVLAIGTRNAK